MTGSHVPHKRLNQVHATFMPEAVWPVHRLPPDSSRSNDSPPVSTSSLRFRTRHQWFTRVRLPDPHL